MQMIFDSEAHVVVHIEYGEQNGYEIVDKAAEQEVFITGKVADAFRAQCRAWDEQAPHVDEVDAYCVLMMQLGRVPVVSH